MTRRRRLAFWAVVAVQAVVLLGMIGINERALAGGEKVTLRTEPVDPLDLFRGNYVALRYEISNVQVPPETRRGDTVYVPLHEAGGVWEGSSGLPSPPSDRTFIRGTVRYVDRGRAEVEYGIETYYAAEEDARRLQNVGQLLVTVVLDDDGQARISHLEPVR
jgi:uncharacterized membrane-anchored protein